jgi:hypothetical protein
MRIGVGCCTLIVHVLVVPKRFGSRQGLLPGVELLKDGEKGNEGHVVGLSNGSVQLAQLVQGSNTIDIPLIFISKHKISD